MDDLQNRPDEPSEHGPAPDYGPRGYLPDRAARRARKIILRGELSSAWVIASVGAALLVLGAGLWFLRVADAPPDPPFTAVVELDAVASPAALVVDADGDPVLLVRAAGGISAFVDPQATVRYCSASGRLESADGAVWTLRGRLIAGPGSSLRPLPTRVVDGTVYVDPTAPGPAPAERREDAMPECPAPP